MKNLAMCVIFNGSLQICLNPKWQEQCSPLETYFSLSENECTFVKTTKIESLDRSPRWTRIQRHWLQNIRFIWRVDLKLFKHQRIFGQLMSLECIEVFSSTTRALLMALTFRPCIVGPTDATCQGQSDSKKTTSDPKVSFVRIMYTWEGTQKTVAHQCFSTGKRYTKAGTGCLCLCWPACEPTTCTSSRSIRIIGKGTD